jgi:hypothetical protein
MNKEKILWHHVATYNIGKLGGGEWLTSKQWNLDLLGEMDREGHIRAGVKILNLVWILCCQIR